MVEPSLHGAHVALEGVELVEHPLGHWKVKVIEGRINRGLKFMSTRSMVSINNALVC